ncbi:restriction endonuclease subunit S [Leucobacter komagatae]|uniref:restriction endonuclease subunit S n=1 Tax=Leucobacter komagatae TaxID=55969 RepID=UPI000696382F|nr:restriction endonuclease subunit S [Leucobacter komagatae]
MTATTFAELIRRGSLIVNDGYRTKQSELTPSGIPILRVAEIGDGFLAPQSEDRISEDYRRAIGVKLSEPGDVLLTTKGTVGRRAIVPESATSFAYSPQVCFFRVLDETIDRRWLYYWLGGSEFWEQAFGVSTQTDMAPYISLRDLRAISIALPKLEEQRAIAATLGALDDKIESNRRAVATISDLLDAISESNGADLPNVPLGDIATSIKDSVNPLKLGDAPVDHFSLPAFDSGARPERVGAASIKSNKLRVPKSAILISRLNPRFNRTWWASAEAETSALASTEFLVLTSEDALELAAVWLAVRDPFFREELPKRVTGTSGSHQRVRPDDLLTINVPDFRGAAPEVKQTTLGLLMRSESLRIESDRLSSLRDALLPELLSGHIRVPVSEVAV